MRKLKYTTIVIIVLLITYLTSLLGGCFEPKITIGKYYTQNNTDSYIEILKNDEILFVNIDFSELEESLNISGSSLSVVDVSNKLRQIQKYDYYKDSSIDGYDFTIQVLIDENTVYGELCLTLRWSKENTLLCLDTIYVHNN